MKKYLSLTIALGLVSGLFAEIQDETLEVAESKIWTASAELSFWTAYPWRNVMSNTEGAAHWYGCIDVDLFGPLSVGALFWQNFDLTDNRRHKYKTSLTESDYNLHAGLKAWESEESEYSLSFEAGIEWYTYHNILRDHNIHPDTSEMYLRSTFDNPFVTVYGGTSWMYRDFGCYPAGFHYDVGLTKSVPITEWMSLGADWNVGFANKPYHKYLIGTNTSGLTGTTVKFFAKFTLSEWASLKATVAYTGIVNGDARSQMDEDRDNLWGSLALSFSY